MTELRLARMVVAEMQLDLAIQLHTLQAPYLGRHLSVNKSANNLQLCCAYIVWRPVAA